MNETFKLYRLQQIDSRLDQSTARLREIETILKDRTTLTAAEKLAEQAAAQLAEARKLLRHAEDEVQAQRIKIEQTEASLYGGKVRNPKELQDLQNEAAALKRYLAVLEDRQLDAMFANEEAESKQSGEFKTLEELRERLARQAEQLIQEQSGLLHDVARQERERTAAASDISEIDMRLYNQLRQQRRGLAVTKVTDRTCSACGSTLSSTLLHNARALNQIVRCDSCGRILYAG